MKKWTVILIILLVLILLSYFISGLFVKHTINKNISAFHDTSVMSIQLDKYQQSWFSSTVLLTLKMHIPEQKTTDKNGAVTVNPPFDFDLSYPLHVDHGPFIITDSGLRFGLGYITTRPQTHYGALIDYFNNTVFRYNLPSLSLNGKSGAEDFQIEWRGLSALLKISPNVDKLDGNLILFGLSGSASNALFQLGEVSNKFKFTYAQGLWLGQSQLSIPSVSLSMGEKPVFHLAAFNLDLNSNLDKGALNYNCTLSLKKLLTQGTTYGPGSFILNIRNLDPQAMAAINRLEWTMLENNQNPELNLLALLAELPKLLSKGSELELSELYFIVPEGKVTGNLKISVPENDLIDPRQLLTKVQGEGQFKAPVALIKKLMAAMIQNEATDTTQTQSSTGDDATISSIAPAIAKIPADPQKQANTLLQSYVDKGLIKIEGNDYVVSIKIVNQQILVNGTVFKPAMLN